MGARVLSASTDPPLVRNLRDKEGRPFTIRPFESADRPGLDAMYAEFEPKRCAQGLPAVDPGQRTRWLNDVLAMGVHLLVEVDGSVTGHGMLIPLDHTAAELANFLHQSCRDRGIGTALNRALLDAARRDAFHRVWLSVEHSNRRAIRSYEKVGFKQRPVSVWAPELEMEITLAP